MSKITFRADDDLVEELEGLDISKSEALREALRLYLEGRDHRSAETPERDSEAMAIDDVVRNRVDELLTQRLESLGVGHHPGAHARRPPQDVNVTITVDGTDTSQTIESESNTPQTDEEGSPSRAGSERQTQCSQCGEHVDSEHVYCPNCGSKTSHRLFCECGDELRSDWSFCPSCGRRTPTADVLESR